MQIEDALVEQVARRLVESDSSADRLLRDQPEVLAFVLASTSQLGPEARKVGVFLGDVVFESFRSAGRLAHAVPTSSLVMALRRNRDMALRVGQAHDRFAERYLKNSNTLRQPALIRYITGVLLEPDEDFAHRVARDELGPLFIVLKSIIDTLDQEERAEEAARAH